MYARQEPAELYTRKVLAGRRTYFVDAKTTRGGDPYLTLTELRKSSPLGEQGQARAKIRVYKEDIVRVQEALSDVVGYIRRLLPDFDFEHPKREPLQHEAPTHASQQ